MRHARSAHDGAFAFERTATLSDAYAAARAPALLQRSKDMLRDAPCALRAWRASTSATTPCCDAACRLIFDFRRSFSMPTFSPADTPDFAAIFDTLRWLFFSC
jgi:hypothetical protein